MKKMMHKKPSFISNIICEKVTFFSAILEEEFQKFDLKTLGTLRIDWDNVENLVDYYADEDNLIECIIKFLSKRNEKDTVGIYWDDGSLLDMQINIACLKKYLTTIYDESESFWIIDANYKWIIECYKGYEVVIKIDLEG